MSHQYNAISRSEPASGWLNASPLRPLVCEKVYLPFCEVADTPFHILSDELFTPVWSWLQKGCLIDTLRKTHIQCSKLLKCLFSVLSMVLCTIKHPWGHSLDVGLHSVVIFAWLYNVMHWIILPSFWKTQPVSDINRHVILFNLLSSSTRQRQTC